MVVERNLVSLRRARNVAMYKLGLAAMLVVTEFLLARLTRLDMSRLEKGARVTVNHTKHRPFFFMTLHRRFPFPSRAILC